MALTVKTKPNSHHRKSRGGHHRQDKHYLKIYHPFLPLLMLVVVGLAISTMWSHRSAVLGVETTTMSQAELLTATNHERTAHHQRALTENTFLASAATAKAQDMATRGYWSHITPDGRTPWSFIQATGYSYQAAGENLAYGFTSANATTTAWMNSPEHRDNLLKASFDQVGFGSALADRYQGQRNVIITVAMYARSAPSSSASTGVTQTSDIGNAATMYPPLRSVARIQLLTGGRAPWSLAIASLIGVAAIALFIHRNGRNWGRLIRHGEQLVRHHVYADVAITALVVTIFVLTRSSGFIH